MVHRPPTSRRSWHQQANRFAVLFDNPLAPTWAPGPLDTFEHFPDLPTELRLVIWKYALIGECSNRMVFLEKQTLRIIKLTSNLVSPLLSANRESRSEAKAFYELKLEVQLMPSRIHNPFYRGYGWILLRRVRLGRATVDDAIQRTGKPNLVVGTLYVSVIRDTFMIFLQKYDDVPCLTLPSLDRLTTMPLVTNALAPGSPRDEPFWNIRRLARSPCAFEEHITIPARTLWWQPPWPLCMFYHAVVQADFAHWLLREARSGWLSAYFPNLRHYGILSTDWDYPQNTNKCFRIMEGLTSKGRRGTRHLFQRFLRRAEVEGKPSWELEVDEAWVNVFPPEQTFELSVGDLEGLVGGV